MREPGRAPAQGSRWPTLAFVAGRACSDLAGNALWLVIGAWLMQSTGTLEGSMSSLFAFSLGAALGPLLGPVADRFEGARVLVLADLVAAAAMSLLWLADASTSWPVYPASILMGAAAAAGSIAEGVMAQTLSAAGGGTRLLALLEAVSQGMRVFAPLAGMLLYERCGLDGVVATCVVMTLFEVAMLCSFRWPARSLERGKLSYAEDWRKAFSFVAGDRGLLGCFLLASLSVFGFGMVRSAAFGLSATDTSAHGRLLADMTTCQAAAGVAASVLLGWRPGLLRADLLLRAGVLAACAGMALECLAYPGSLLLGAVMIGAASTAVMIGTMSQVFERTPGHLIGRVESALGVLVLGAQLLASGLAACLLNEQSCRAWLMVVAGALLLAAFSVGRRPVLRIPEP
ncbi:MFS transporter [Rhizobacter sp. P5_C2]